MPRLYGSARHRLSKPPKFIRSKTLSKGTSFTNRSNPNEYGKTQRHKDTEAQSRAVKRFGCAPLCLCVFCVSVFFIPFESSTLFPSVDQVFKRPILQILIESPSLNLLHDFVELLAQDRLMHKAFTAAE